MRAAMLGAVVFGSVVVGVLLGQGYFILAALCVAGNLPNALNTYNHLAN